MADFSTKHIGYLMRSYLDDCNGRIEQPIDSSKLHVPDPASIGMVEIAGLSRFWDPQAPRRADPKKCQYRMFDVLAGCCGAGLPMLFAVIGTTGRIRVLFGAEARGGASSRAPDCSSSSELIRRLLFGHYPGLSLATLSTPAVSAITRRLASQSHVGFVCGMPSNKASEEQHDPTQIDRLIRTMFGSEWAFVVRADPVDQRQTTEHLSQVLNEMRAVENAEQPKMRRSPLAESYFKLLEQQQQEFLAARSTGLWSMSAYYLAGDAATLQRLGSAVRSCFGGTDSTPDPIRTIEWAQVAHVAPHFGRLLTEADEGPGRVRHPLAYQTLLTSERLGTMVHLPRHEMPGYTVRENVRFDVAPHDAGENAIRLGEVLDRGQKISADYHISLASLTKHAMVVGVTGGGKTNTTFHLLRQLWQRGIPFLVLEPAKTEYRALLNDETIGPDLQVFTAGDETTSPLRLSPFEVEAGVSVATHIDLIKATFNASFAMWSPLPQVLERCIHDVYREAGWDIVRNTNRRLPHDEPQQRSDAFPTITELYEAVERVVSRLGYDDKITSDIRAALGTRLHSLRIGGKGAMLDTRRSIPMSHLLSRPTVIELEPVGDDDEKAFIMGLLLMKLYEHHRAGGTTEGNGLKHVVVIEEAHRLLANIPPTSGEDSSNVKGKAVEAFVNMLSEVRAYGQGFMVAEQIPGKLAPDVIKNTNLKVIHRTVAGDDRDVLARTTNMTQEQSAMLATLEPGQAAVFSEGDDRPLMVRVPYAKLVPPSEMSTKSGSDRVVANRMASFALLPETASRYQPLEFFPASREWSGDLIEFATQVAERRTFQELMCALALAAIEAPEAMPLCMSRLLGFVEASAPQFALSAAAMQCVLAHGVRWYVSHFGRRLEWLYDAARNVGQSMADTVMTLTAGEYEPSIADAFRSACDAACNGRVDRLTGYGWVPPAREALYRYHVELLLRDAHLSAIFDQGMSEAGTTGTWSDLSALDQVIARLGGFDFPLLVQDALARSYAAQQIAFKPGLLEIARALAREKVMEALDHRFQVTVSDPDDQVPESTVAGESDGNATP